MTDTATTTRMNPLPQWSAIVVAIGLALGVSGAHRMAAGPVAKRVSPASVVAIQSAKVVERVAVIARQEVPTAATPDISVSSEFLHDAPAVPASEVVAPVGLTTKKPRVIWMQVTAYCACKKCCGPGTKGITASGRHISYNGGHFVAADTKVLAFETKLQIPGYADGKAVEVIDRGGAIKGNHIDLFMPTHQQAADWGNKWMQVTIVE